MSRVAVYVRVSSQEQADKDLSIPAQRRELADAVLPTTPWSAQASDPELDRARPVC